MTIRIPPAPPRITGNADRSYQHEVNRLRAAAWHARRVYPGALGEVVSRELRASADLGLTLGIESVMSLLARQVLATRAVDDSQEAAAPPDGPDRLREAG